MPTNANGKDTSLHEWHDRNPSETCAHCRTVRKTTRDEELSKVVEDLSTHVPLEISAGRVHFQCAPTSELVAERLHKVREVVDSLPEEELRLEGREAYDARGRHNFIYNKLDESWIENGLRNDKNLFP